MALLHQFVSLLRDGEQTPEELTETCAARVRALDPELHAWLELAPQPATGSGALSGIPFAAKDIFETAGLLSEYGSPLYRGRRSTVDASLVADLRARGAILMGKTHTTAFAFFDPAPTRNPRNPQHTPGGSSSGSAAAVAAGMVPFALGSQTQGSVLRPASFCGIAGFKPTFGWCSREGMLPFAPSLDTAGFFTGDAADMALLWTLLDRPVPTEYPVTLAVPRDGLDVEPPMMAGFKDTVGRLGAAGFRVTAIDFPKGSEDLATAVRTIQFYEGGRTLESLWRQHGAALGVKLAGMVEEGLAMSKDQYQEAVGLIDSQKQAFCKLFEEFGLLATPAAVGPAPAGLSSTGDPRMNAPWTGLGVPAISIPMPAGTSLPLGLQLAGPWNQDGGLLAAAMRAESIFAVT
ncbi:MAG: amidase [Bryobacteraceae bacterium]